MKTIVLMTDFSDNARNAIKFAIGVFGQEVEYVLLNSFELNDTSSLVPGKQIESLLAHSEADLAKDEAFLKSNLPQYSDLKIKLKGEFAEPHTALERIASQIPVDLVIMGTKGASGLKKVLIGTVTATVLKKTSLPVLVVPEQAPASPLEKIVFASDLHNFQKKTTVRPLLQIAEKFNAEVTLLNIMKKSAIGDGTTDQKIQELERSGYLEGLNKTWLIKIANNVPFAIDQYCMENEVDLLVTVERHNRFFDRLFHRSISRELIYESKLPVLVLDDT